MGVRRSMLWRTRSECSLLLLSLSLQAENLQGLLQTSRSPRGALDTPDGGVTTDHAYKGLLQNEADSLPLTASPSFCEPRIFSSAGRAPL
jgi:hypothetical protein